MIIQKKENTSIHLLIAICLSLFFSGGCMNFRLRRDTSISQIEMLHKNVLLVRLNSADKKIEYLKSIKEFERAKSEAAKTKQTNSEIIKAFDEYFNFCKVYFFYPSQAVNLKNERFDAMVLLNANGEEISDKAFLNNGYIVSTFGYIYENEFVYQDEKNRISVGGTNILPALVLMDNDYIQLVKPFPNGITVNHTSVGKADAIKLLNKELHEFYNKSVFKKTNFKRRKNLKIIKY